MESVEVDRRYLWALQVLACDSLEIPGETQEDNETRYQKAVKFAHNANLNQPNVSIEEEVLDY
jgi:hypothetical protein